MSLPIWVLSVPAAPGASFFGAAGGLSTPIVIDESTDTAYYLKPGVGPTPIGPGSSLYVLENDFFTISTSPQEVTAFTFTPDPDYLYIIEGQLLAEVQTAGNSYKITLDWPPSAYSGAGKLAVRASSTTETLAFGSAPTDFSVTATSQPAATTFPVEVSATFRLTGSPGGSFKLALSLP